MIRHALLLLALQLALAIAAALVLAVLWALAHGGPFAHSFAVACLVVGALVFLVAAIGVGGMSPSSGIVNTAGRIPGLRADTRVSPGTTSVSSTAILFLTAVALLALGFVLNR